MNGINGPKCHIGYWERGDFFHFYLKQERTELQLFSLPLTRVGGGSSTQPTPPPLLLLGPPPPRSVRSREAPGWFRSALYTCPEDHRRLAHPLPPFNAPPPPRSAPTRACTVPMASASKARRSSSRACAVTAPFSLSSRPPLSSPPPPPPEAPKRGFVSDWSDEGGKGGRGSLASSPGVSLRKL